MITEAEFDVASVCVLIQQEMPNANTNQKRLILEWIDCVFGVPTLALPEYIFILLSGMLLFLRDDVVKTSVLRLLGKSIYDHDTSSHL